MVVCWYVGISIQNPATQREREDLLKIQQQRERGRIQNPATGLGRREGSRVAAQRARARASEREREREGWMGEEGTEACLQQCNTERKDLHQDMGDK